MLRHTLSAEEELRWTGRPDPVDAAKRRIPLFFAGAAVILLSLLAQGRLLPGDVVHLWFLPVRTTAMSGMTGPASLLGVAAGIACLLAPFIAYRRALNTEYAVTDRRVLLLRQGMLGRQERHVRFTALDRPVLRMRAHGAGDILLAPRKRGVLQDTESLQGIFGIRNVLTVHDLIVELWNDEHAKQAATTAGPDYLELLLQGKRPY